MKRWNQRHRGQALAETALVIVPLVFLALLGVNVLMLHRVRTAATAAAYSCAQHVIQVPHRPERAASIGMNAAQAVLSGPWSALGQANFYISPFPPERPGRFGGCSVRYEVTLFFALPGLQSIQGNTVQFGGAGERWQGRW